MESFEHFFFVSFFEEFQDAQDFVYEMLVERDKDAHVLNSVEKFLKEISLTFNFLKLTQFISFLVQVSQSLISGLLLLFVERQLQEIRLDIFNQPVKSFAVDIEELRVAAEV